MQYTQEVEQLRETLVRNYVEALNTLSIEPIVESIHPDFKYMLYGSFGIASELRYLGFLYKAFHQIKEEGKSINAELLWLENGLYKYPAVKINQPTDTRILYQFEWYYKYNYEVKSIDHDVVLYVRIKENKIFRVLCEEAITVHTGKWLPEMCKPTDTFITIDDGRFKGRSQKVPPKRALSGQQYVIFPYLPLDQQAAWKEIMGEYPPNVYVDSYSKNYTPSYEDYEAFYDWWVNGTPVNRDWFKRT